MYTKIILFTRHSFTRHSTKILFDTGVHPDFLVKFDFEIAFDQQTRACDQTFEGFLTPGAHRCLRDSKIAHISVRDIRETDFAQNNRTQ